MAYASEYYDPAKAKEYNKWYYETHKKLKGRNTSTAGLNDQGRSVAKTVKTNIDAETQAINEQIDEEYATAMDELKSSVKSEIDALRLELRGMSKEERAAKKEQYQQKIDELREQLKEALEELREQKKEEKQTVKEEQYNKYADELAKIRQDSAMVITNSVALLDDTGKELAKKEKERIKEELQYEIDKKKEEMNAEIDKIRLKLTKRTLSKRERAELLDKVQTLMVQNAEDKTKLQKEYDEKYTKTLDRIRQSHMVSSYTQEDE